MKERRKALTWDHGARAKYCGDDGPSWIHAWVQRTTRWYGDDCSMPYRMSDSSMKTVRS